MSKIIKTLKTNINIFFESYFDVPFISAILITFLFVILLLILKKYKKSNIAIKPLLILFLFFDSFYFCELFYTTLIYRINQRTDSLSDVFGEWSIYDGETLMYINPKPILNVILFIPVCFVIFHLIKYLYHKKFRYKKIIGTTTLASFAISLFIELTQLIFSLGTFQFSDLFYNTLGGLLGALVYIFVLKIHKKISTKR